MPGRCRTPYRKRSAASAKLWTVLSLLVAACSHDWDEFDPRLGPERHGDGSSDGPSGGAGTSGNAGASGGNGATGTGGASGGGGGTGGATGGVGGAAGSGGTATGGSGGVGGSGGTTGGGASGLGGLGGLEGGIDGSAGSGGSTGGVSGSDAGPTTVSYVATVAECINPQAPDPVLCESIAGAGSMTIDQQEQAPYTVPFHGFFRFDLDSAIAGKTILSVRLELHTNGSPTAASSTSGSIWQTVTFVLSDLSGSAAPARVGAAPIAGDLGAVAAYVPLVWTLPNALAVASSPLCLELAPGSTDGLDIYNARGAIPPRLVVEFQ